MEYPSYKMYDQPGQPRRFICFAGPSHAVDIFETTDPHNSDPLGFEYRVLRSRPTVKRFETEGQSVERKEWFRMAAEMMLTHLGSIEDLVTICNLQRESANVIGGKPDYSGVTNILQEIKPSRRAMVSRKLEQGALPILGQ